MKLSHSAGLEGYLHIIQSLPCSQPRCDMNTSNQETGDDPRLFCHPPIKKFQGKTTILSSLIGLFEGVKVDKTL